MKFTLTSAYGDLNKEIEINSLDELKNLPERFKKNYNGNNKGVLDYIWSPPYSLVVDFEDMTITIYDGYLE